jgi:hypothetical protein
VQRENLDFRILSILDNTSAHMLEYVSLSENVKAIYMPLKEIAVMPMDQV